MLGWRHGFRPAVDREARRQQPNHGEFYWTGQYGKSLCSLPAIGQRRSIGQLRQLAQTRPAIMFAFPPVMRTKRTSGLPNDRDLRVHGLILSPVLHHGTIAQGHFPRYEYRCSCTLQVKTCMEKEG